MKLKHLSRVFVLIILVLALGVPSVYASWVYSLDYVDSITYDIELGVSLFTWTGYEDLPDSVEGENHAWLIYNIVNGVDESGDEIGLNNPKSVINTRIEARLDGGLGWREGRDYFGSMAITGGDEVSKLFDAHSNGLSFAVRVVSDTEYRIYTTSVYLGEKGEINIWGNNKTAGKPSIPIGSWIYPVYETIIIRENKNSEFKIIETKRGRAKSDWYDENRSNANATQIPAFDVHTWEPAEMGTKETPILTFVGDSPTAYATKEMHHLYYQISPKNTGTYTVWTDNLDAEIAIFSNISDIEGSTIVKTTEPSLQSDGTYRVQVSWTVSTAGSSFYIEITGDDVMQFHIV